MSSALSSRVPLAPGAAVEPRVADLRLPYGLRLRLVELGDPAGEPVLLLHGVTDSSFSFSRVLPLLPPHRRLIALDQRGHGGSDRPADGYDLPSLAADALGVMDALGIARAALVGHSMGSLVAQHVAALAPERVSRLVLVGSAADCRSPTVRELAAAVAGLEDPVPEEFVREFQYSTVHLPPPEAFMRRAIAESLAVPAHVWRAAIGGLTSTAAVADLRRIVAPTLILWGEHDAVFGRADQDALRASLARAELRVFEDTGHAPHWERPERFAAVVGAFVG